MTFKYGNWLGENTSTIGQGPINLGGAVPGFSTFIYLGDGQIYYTIVDGNKKECGIGTITGRVMERTTVIATLVDGVYTENAAPLTLTGSAQVFGTINSEFFKSVLLDTENAASATKLATARNIGGVPFDGTADIDLPGVNQSGNQNTSGNSGTSTKLANPVAITIAGASKNFDGSAPISWTAAEIGAVPLAGFRNKIHNGKMEVCQRGSPIQIPVNTLLGTIDRFAVGNSTTLRGIVTQEPVNASYPRKSIKKCMAITPTTPLTGLLDSHNLRISYFMEGYDVAQFTEAPSILSFVAYTTVAGKYTLALRNGGKTKTILKEYTLPAGAFTLIEIALPALPDSFAITDFGSGTGVELIWTLAAGNTFLGGQPDVVLDGSFFKLANQVIWGTSVSDRFYLTEIQWEPGTQRTPFEHRPYEVELALCQRYLLSIGRDSGTSGTIAAGGVCTASVSILSIGTPVQMRATPTFEGGTLSIASGSGAVGTGAVTITMRGPNIMINQNISGAAGQSSYLSSSQTTGFRGFNAELT